MQYTIGRKAQPRAPRPLLRLTFLVFLVSGLLIFVLSAEADKAVPAETNKAVPAEADRPKISDADTSHSASTKEETVSTDASEVGRLPSLTVPEDFDPSPSLSSEARISLVTIYPGKAVYSTFGHTAIRIQDPKTGMDLLYNYGQSSVPFDSGFVPNFVSGYLPFKLGVIETERAYDFYRNVEDRTIYEQELRLDPDRSRELYRFLSYNALEENRVYIYDFFFDNCTTRIRDLFTYLYGSSLTYELRPQDKTFREIIAPYMQAKPFIIFGINLMFGSPSDHSPSLDNRLFLPIQLEEAIEGARIKGMEEPHIEASTRTIYFQQREDPSPSLFGPAALMWLIAGIALIASFPHRLRRSKAMRLFDLLIYLLAGIIGGAMTLLWSFSGYEMTTSNFNILWAWPTHLIFAFFLLGPNIRLIRLGDIHAGGAHSKGALVDTTPASITSRIAAYYFAAASAAVLLFLPLVPVIPQTIPPAALPFLFALGFRGVLRSGLLSLAIKKIRLAVDRIGAR